MSDESTPASGDPGSPDQANGEASATPGAADPTPGRADGTPGQPPAAAEKPPQPKVPRSQPKAPRSRKKPGAADKTTPRNPGVRPGGEIAGYKLEEQIGEGGMAVVYRARDERLDRRVALKLLAPGLAADAAFRQRFIRESRAAAAVDHPNIIPVYDAGDAGGALFIAMRFVQGGDVRSLLSRNGPLSAARVFDIITQVAAALDAAHARGLIHRDVKPANMLLDSADAPTAADSAAAAADRHEHVYLSDFGISKQSLASQQLTSTGQFVGTLDYIAPEQIEGRAVDGRADQYALGCAAFELLSGVPPYRKEQHLAIIAAHLSETPPSLAATRPDLPRIVDQVLAKAMAKTPDGRYASCAQFAADLGRALGLAPGPIEALGGAGVPAGPGPDAPPQAWPATELAGRQSGPGPWTGHDGLAGGPPGTPPHGLGAQPPAPPAQDPAAARYHLDAATVQSGPQAHPGGTAPLGSSAQGYGQQLYGQGAYGTGPQGPGPYGGPGPYAPGQYGGSGPYAPGPYGPGPQGPASPPPRRSRAVIAAVIVAVLAVGAATGILLRNHLTSGPGSPTAGPTSSQSSGTPTSPSPSPTVTATGQSQATAISNLLTTSAATRSPLQSAVNDVGTCSDLAASVNQIRRVRNQRQTEYGQAQTLTASALPSGGTLLTDLRQALFYSLRADNDYLVWGQQQRASCVAGSQANANSDNDQAASYKTQFVSLWNPIASQYNLPAASAGTI